MVSAEQSMLWLVDKTQLLLNTGGAAYRSGYPVTFEQRERREANSALNDVCGNQTCAT